MISASWPGTRCAAWPGQLAERVVGLVHLRQVGDHPEGPVALELLVEVHRVGGEHDPAGDGAMPTTIWPGEWPPSRMACTPSAISSPPAGGARAPRRPRRGLAQLGRLDAWANCARRASGPSQKSSSRAGDEQLGVGEEAEVADVVVVQVGDHDARDRLGADARAPPSPRAGSIRQVRPRRRPTRGRSRCRRGSSRRRRAAIQKK